MPIPPDQSKLESRRPVPTWLELATSRSIVLRSLLIAVVVGSILCVINHVNHGGCIFGKNFNKACLLQSLLTAVVPYIVSVVSSVHAIRREIG